MNDIKVPPFTEEQKELIKMTEKLANGRKICDVDDVDDVKDIKEILKEAITKIENQKQTNFQRITASPEALAEFIENHCNCINCPTECPATEMCNDYKNCYRALVEWLKKENEDENMS